MSTVLNQFIKEKEFATIEMDKEYFKDLVQKVLSDIYGKDFLEGREYNLTFVPDGNIWVSMTNVADYKDLQKIVTALGLDVKHYDYTMIDPTFIIRYIMDCGENAWVMRVNNDDNIEIELPVVHIRSYKDGSLASILANYVREKEYGLVEITLETFTSLMEEILESISGKTMKNGVDFTIEAEVDEAVKITIGQIEDTYMNFIKSVLLDGTPENIPSLIIQQDLDGEAWVKTATNDGAVILELPLNYICNPKYMY
jgi:hypothetical protein